MKIDTKQLESLSYGSRTCLSEQAHLMNENDDLSRNPASSPPEILGLPKNPIKTGFLGLNAHVLRPETKVNKVEDADKLLYETLGPTCKTCGRVFE